MGRIESSFLDIGHLDALSNGNSVIHRLDPRVKLLTTLLFVVLVLSFDKYAIVRLVPFVVFPVALVALADLPAGYLFRKVLLAAPFVIFVGIFNPLLDRVTVMTLGSVEISGGWVSFASILIRFVLTVGAAVVLIAVTGFNTVCLALEKMGVPKVFAVQLLFLYRYIFVLGDEAARLVRARSLRTFGSRGSGFQVFSYLVGQLLLRTLDRAKRIHLAMLCRGFDGEIRVFRPFNLRGVDLGFLTGWAAMLLAFRLVDIPAWLGGIVSRLAS